jgi:hypothetical protein
MEKPFGFGIGDEELLEDLVDKLRFVQTRTVSVFLWY